MLYKYLAQQKNKIKMMPSNDKTKKRFKKKTRKANQCENPWPQHQRKHKSAILTPKTIAIAFVRFFPLLTIHLAVPSRCWHCTATLKTARPTISTINIIAFAQKSGYQ